MSEQLKDLLKPPFRLDEFGTLKNGLVKIDHNYCEDKDSRTTVSLFIMAAIEEQYKRDCSEPLRWIYRPSNISPAHNYWCPKCDKVEIMVYNFCPHCGQKLDPPEGELNV